MSATAQRATPSPTRAERERDTAADKRLYTEIGLAPVECTTCGVEVGVKKNSRKHTSVQWTAAAMAGCSEFAAQRAHAQRASARDPSGTNGVLLGCPRLKDSIEAAVRDGLLVVPDE